MFGRRPDGRRLDDIDPIISFMPYIMKTRNDAMNLITLSVDYEPIAEYIRKRSKEGAKISFMALIAAAYVRATAEYPELNRFIANKQVFARNKILISLAVLKRGKNKESLDEDLVKMEFTPAMTVDEIALQMNKQVEEAVNSNNDGGTGDFAAKLVKHRIILQAVVLLARLLDRYGIMPKFLYDLSPFHCSMFITNMASIGMPPLYHHLYNFGNTSVFIAMGKAEKQTVSTREGFTTKQILPLCVTTDERICGGAAYAQAFKLFKKLLEHPEELEKRPETVKKDFDFDK